MANLSQYLLDSLNHLKPAFYCRDNLCRELRRKEKAKRKKERELRKSRRQEQRKLKREKNLKLKLLKRQRRKHDRKRKTKEHVIIDDVIEEHTGEINQRRKRAATARPERIWDYGVIPYEIEASFSGRCNNRNTFVLHSYYMSTTRQNVKLVQNQSIEYNK